MCHHKVSQAWNNSLRAMFLLLVAGALVTSTGCAWFKKHKPEVKPPVSVTPPAEPTAPPSNTDEQHGGGQTIPFPAGAMYTVYFDYDKATIRRNQVANLASDLKYLQDHPEDKVMIEGHCDERGTLEYNFSLGQKRATAVKDYFIKNGLKPERIATISKGEEEPVDPGHSEAAWKKNRRAEFKKIVQ